LAKKLLSNNEHAAAYHGRLVGTNERYIEESIHNIVSHKARIIFVSTTGPQMVKLFCQAYKNNMFYPNYLWIVVDYLLSSLEDEIAVSNCDVHSLHVVLEGSLIVYLTLNNPFSDESYKTKEYLNEYYNEIKSANVSHPLEHDIIYAGCLYDQIWAFALALNDSLQTLSKANISTFDHYQPDMVNIIEKSLLRVNFQGVTGLIKFTENHEVLRNINIYQIINGTTVPSCIYGSHLYQIHNLSFTDCNLTFSDALDDELPTRINLLPKGLVIFMYTCTGLVVGFTTCVLLSMICNRNKPEIKAFSLSVNLLIFMACYLLCASQVISVTLISFYIESEVLFASLCGSEMLINFTSTTLIFLTLFVQLFRISRIFGNKKLRMLSFAYSNWSLMLIATLLACILTAVCITCICIFKLERHHTVDFVMDSFHCLVQEYTYYCGKETSQILIVPAVCTISNFFFLVLNVVFASRTHAITSKMFRNTKKVNFFIACVIIIQCLSIAIVLLLREENLMLIPHMVNYLMALSIVLLSQITLFVPKLFSIARHTIISHYQ
jgi:gamma-aminobutyric acid type B receptor